MIGVLSGRPPVLRRGAMIFVVAEELVPEANRGSPDIAALALG